MPDLTDAEVRVFPDPDALAEAIATEVCTLVQAAIRLRGECALALSGGGTPRALHGLLADRFAPFVGWDKLHLFWSDERYVPHDSPASNFRMARETLTDLVPISSANLHPILTDLPDPEDAARTYEAILRGIVPGDPPRLDLALLGLGPDGHTASLFAHSEALAETERLVVASLAPDEPRQRITLTYPMINAAAAVFFMVVSEDKAAMVARALDPTTPTDDVPAAGVRPDDGRLIWWLDEAAASLLD